jgi:antitoxin component of MazEF toxin-antitoxin module
MTIKSIQKVIKIGDSLAVTIPARDAKAAGIVQGSSVDVSVKPVVVAKKASPSGIEAEYEAFTIQYGQTLKNLADR